MKIIKRVFLIALIGIVIVVYFNYPKLNLISGFASKNMASTVFIANRSPVSINENDHNVPLIKLADVRMDKNSTTASVFGLQRRRSIYREGLGAVLINQDYDSTRHYLMPKRIKKSSNLPFPLGDGKPLDTIYKNVNYPKLEAAIAQSFSDPEIKKTRSVLVYYKNTIIGEKYLDGFTESTPILGWSATKSIIATLYGILEYQGKIDLNAPAPVAAWKNDERKNITLNHLLRMQSGLAWEEDYSKISDVTKMLFLATDMTKAQKEKEAMAKPTEIWNYSSGTSNLLSGILRNKFTSEQAYLDFPYSALIDKIGMYSMIIETDLANNYVGSSYAWANTRDWAKFGILYLNEGNWNGQQLFDKKWVSYITTPTAHSKGVYGAHFWLNAEGKYPDVPRDMYSANGFQGQRIFIIPSKDLVIVRTGLAEEPEFDINSFLKAILSAIN